MPKRAKELQPIQVQRIKRPGYHPVGGVAGLLLCVKPSGAKSWVLRYSTGETRTSSTGRPFAVRRDMGLGPYPDVGLAKARERAREARDLLYQGIDPLDQRKRQREALKSEQETRLTFAEVWPEFFAKKRQELSATNRQHWKASIENYALPVIGSRIVADIEMRHILNVLEPVWTEKTMLAKKLRGRLEAVLSFATVKGYRQGDNPARWADNLKEVLPKPSKVHTVRHFRALPIDEAPEFMEALRARNGNAARALEFCILTAARSGEVRGARWDEIDTKRGRWSIPAERMKMDRDHLVPLSDAALAVLAKMPRDNDLIFPAPRGGQLSDMSLLAVVKRMGFKGKSTVHGFRSTFKDWATEETDTQDFISEMALAHSVGDEVQAAYRRSDLAAKRLKLMRQWSQFLGYPEKGAAVVKLEARA
jgi:integrase